MNRTKWRLRIIAASAGISAAAMVQAGAAQEERLTVDVGQCVNLPTPEQRLACFEAQVEAARTPSTAAQPAPPAAATPPTAATTPPTRATAPAAPPAAATPPAAPVTTTVARLPPGSAPEDFGFRERRAEPEAAQSTPEVRATVTAMRETVPNAYLITLDNGQVWRQTRPDSSMSLRVGQPVRIYFTRWRAYRLESPNTKGFVQVERVR